MVDNLERLKRFSQIFSDGGFYSNYLSYWDFVCWDIIVITYLEIFSLEGILSGTRAYLS